MRILLDNCVPRKFAKDIVGHDVVHARQIGWHELQNGTLIRRAEEAQYEVMITTDKNLQFQQNLAGRQISIIVLKPTLVFYENLLPLLGPLADALTKISPGSLVEIFPA